MAVEDYEGGVVNRSSIEAMRGWARIFGVSQSEILIAVAAVGNRAEAVRAYLAAPWPAPR